MAFLGSISMGDFVQFFQAFLGKPATRQLSRTTKFLLNRRKKGANAFFVHNFVIPYLYKLIT